MRKLVPALLALVLLAGGASEVFAQGFTGGIRGAIKDTGGVIPGAEVTLTNEATNVARSTTSNEAGEYNFPNLGPGTYTLKASLQGYKTYLRAGLVVGTQQFLTLDVALEVGALEETITVTGQAPLIETSNASTGTVLNAEALQTLPAPGRNAFMIGTTVPTVVPSGDTQFNRQQDQTNAALLSLGGGTRRGNNYTLDGVPITDLRNRASANPTIESLEDVKVQVHTYDAEMGRTGGGVFNTTLRSGGNAFRGSAFYQTRPIWGQSNNYFSEKAGLDKPQSPYHLGGGGVGGPIVRNRTFFWFATENYTDTQTRNASEVMPTAAERAGDFSGLTTSSGQPVIIYDPVTRTPFQNNRIPTERINPVAANMLKYLPLPDTNRDNGTVNYNRNSLIKSEWTQEYTGKVEHKFTDNMSLTGFFLYNKSDEPCGNYFGSADQKEPTRFADPNDYLLKRRPKILALNNTWVLSNTSVMALRYGWTEFPDNSSLSIDFDPSTLGFSQTYINQIQVDKFPSVRIRNYDTYASQTLGAINPTDRNWKSQSINGSLSKIIGTHTYKVGADFRKIALDFFASGNTAGLFEFDKDTTSSNGSNSIPTEGNSFASFLLGFPSALSDRQSSITLSSPINMYTYYSGAYVQDDWRISPKLTVNYGLRLEHESGMAEENDKITVGFDPKVTNALSTVVIPADPVAGTPARTVAGGLLYAGVDGNERTQGNAPAIKWSPRVGTAYSLNDKTVLRGGYGLYWAPFNYPDPSGSDPNYGHVGVTQNTVLAQTTPVPTTTLTNPYPNGLVQPLGNSLRTLTGVGTNISYVDQNSSAPRVHQYSIDLQRELPGSQSFTVSYMGATGRHLGLGGSNDYGLNINQLDPKYMSLGPALNDNLQNPFAGNPNAGPFASRSTLTRAQLLRPFPQFGNINARMVLEGKSQYHAGVFEYTKRITNGWGGRVSYTYSQLKDNLVGEGNFYGPYTTTGPGTLNAHAYIQGDPYYNPDLDYGYSLLDVPHRFIVAPVYELPFGRGKPYGADNQWVDWIAGGWTVSAAMNFQSGFPLAVVQSDNTGTFGGVQRPNLTGADLSTSGSYEDRLASADHPAATWLDPAGFSAAAPFTFGNAPRTLPDARTAAQYNVDGVFIKNVRFGTKVAQAKLEMLNMFNRVNVRTLRGTQIFPATNFGRTTLQAGFMRIFQFSFRFSF